MKRCVSCDLEKDESQFSRRKDTGKLRGQCKECIAITQKQYAEKHAAEINIYQQDYRTIHLEEFTNNAIRWKKENPEKAQKAQAKYRKTHATERAAYNERFTLTHPNYRSEYDAQRRANDMQFRISHNLRTRLGEAIKNGQKIGSAVDDLGCTIEYFMEYMAAIFYANPETGAMMSWDNYGEWHIDHIKPLALFDLTNREQFLAACNYTNLQPLWAKENLSKGAKYVEKAEDVSDV